jgi:hypothetical protein
MWSGMLARIVLIDGLEYAHRRWWSSVVSVMNRYLMTMPRHYHPATVI